MSKYARDLSKFVWDLEKELAYKRVGSTSNWTWHMHPSTWITVKRDVEFVRYAGEQLELLTDFKAETLVGIPVLTDMDIPRGVVELRFSDRLTLAMDGA
jgi:hypothetical protein